MCYLNSWTNEGHIGITKDKTMDKEGLCDLFFPSPCSAYLPLPLSLTCCCYFSACPCSPIPFSCFPCLKESISMLFSAVASTSRTSTKQLNG